MPEPNLTKDSISSLIKHIAIPASVGFFFNTMYNIVDTIYAGFLSTQAIAALSLSFPIFFIIIGLGVGIGQGTSALLANALGAKEKKKVCQYAIQSLSFAFILGIIMTIIGMLAAPSLFRLLGATDAYLVDSLAYMNVILYAVVFFFITFMFNSILNAYGDTKSFRNALIVGFVLNLFLNPIFMFGWWVFPEMGLAGIGLATAIIEVLTGGYLLYKVIKLGIFKGVKARYFIPKMQPFKDISVQGFPASLNMLTVAIGIFIITFFISKFGPAAVAAYGIATRIEQFVLMPTIGLNIAALTLIGQNNGAKKYKRVHEIYRKAISYGSYMMIAGGILVLALAKQLIQIFTKDTEVIAIGVPYLRIAAFIFVAYILLFVSVSALQGLKRPMYGMIIGALRQIIGPIIVFWFLVEIAGWGIFGIWWGVFIITWAAAIYTIFYCRRVMNTRCPHKS